MRQYGRGLEGMTRDVAAILLSRAGITDPSLINLYREYGGTLLGLELLKRSAHDCGLTVPLDVAISLEEAAVLSSEVILNSLPAVLRVGFALKYSGHSESFSPDCQRGKNSSRHRFWDGTDQAEATRRIEAAIHNAPLYACTLVFQQYISDPRMSGVFYAYCYGDRTLVEASSAGKRVFTEVHADRAVRRASVTGKHIQSGSRRQADPLILHRRLQALRARVGFDLDMEGFESDTGIIAVQLRPIPDDMPRLPVTQPGENGTNWYRTPLVWGAWMNGATVVDVDVAGEPAIMLKRASSLAECPDITRRLERGDHTLVVDIVDGFRLSHDPRYLPEVVQHRRGYAYISVVGTPLANLQPGETIEAFVDGDTGLIRRANTVTNN